MVQVPQLFRSDLRSWQLEPQQVSAVFTQGWVIEQPWAQAFWTQICPAVQSVSPKHSTHLLVAASHFAFGLLQSVPSVHPAAQPLFFVQYCPVGHLSLVGVHSTQVLLAVSHTGVVPEHSESLVHPPLPPLPAAPRRHGGPVVWPRNSRHP